MDKVISNLGLAKRAGKIITGTEMVVEGLRNNKVCLVFLASDTAINTTKKIKDKSAYYNADVIDKYTSDELSLAIGGKNCRVIGIVDQGFAKILKE